MMIQNPLEVFDAGMTVFGAPGRYVQGQGLLDRTGAFAAQLGHSAVLVADAVILPLIAPRIAASCAASGVVLEVLPFAGKLLRETAAELEAALGARAPEVVIAAGGGRAIDAGKALAGRRDLALITVPTVASNDAPTSKNYVLYDEAGQLAEVCHLRRSPDFVVVDTAVLAGAPRAMFAAGLGDALSKKAEAEACAQGRGTTMFLSRPPRLALTIAAQCHAVLMDHGAAALDAAGTGQPTPAFEAAVEAMILMAGLGFESGGLSVPHALTRGVPLLPGGAAAPHGFQVAWGLLVHHRLLGEALPADLSALFTAAGLPRSLAALTGQPVGPAQIRALAGASLPVRHILNFPRVLDLPQLIEAIECVEAAGERGSGRPCGG
ncbi:iron-containing alcohol dehydrogenase [Pseudogemmobacter bohemicus]|uniref:iron-containing alcohol dehydrogenase n=1 Tax=Pseudogemmobacter bohemicus TaxID=2250708 RepID=UPI0018E57A2B|nr:iron-containing alcohol dehydrogenase [Pseudogemmobacter bohemicus]